MLFKTGKQSRNIKCSNGLAMTKSKGLAEVKCRDLLTILSECDIKQTVMPGKLVTTTQCLPNPALMFHSHKSTMIQAMQVRGVLWKYASNRLVFHEHGSYFHLQYFLLWHCQNGAFF